MQKQHTMLILGSGKMAKAIAYDFVKQKNISKVVIASHHKKSAQELCRWLKSRKAEAVELDMTSTKQVIALMKRTDCAVSAVPYIYNFELAKAAVSAGCHFIDLGGNNDIVKQEFSLSKAAKKKGIAIIPDTGLAPGLVSNLTAHGMLDLPNPLSVQLRVGGLPQNPKPPLDYMIVFSVTGLINEYIEPAVIIKDYKIKAVPGMSDVEYLKFPGIGEFEAFYTSGGTSTLPQTFKGRIKNLDYKTIRYKGHAAQIKLLMDLGLTSSREIELKGRKIAPRDVLEKLFEENLSFKDKDMIVLKAVLEDNSKRIEYTLVDYETPELTAMMRCTGFPAAVIAEMLVNGDIKKRGTLKQELDINPVKLVQELRKRGLRIVKKVYKKN